MASHLDLEEQEQLDQLKAFWTQYGNLITWALIAALAAFAGWNGWNWWQREQAVKASAMFDELERSAQAGDAARVARVAGDLRDQFAGTAYAAQGALVAARLQFEKGEADAARSSLTWVAEKGGDEALRTVARLRLAGLLLEAKQYDDALRQLNGATAPGFEALVADRRGDVLLAQGKKAEAITAYEAAYKGIDAQLDYRRLVDAKLTALGAAPSASAAESAK